MTGFIPSLQVVVSSGVHFKKMKEEVNLLSFRKHSANKLLIGSTPIPAVHASTPRVGQLLPVVFRFLSAKKWIIQNRLGGLVSWFKPSKSETC
jgi:hypothetical protein